MPDKYFKSIKKAILYFKELVNLHFIFLKKDHFTVVHTPKEILKMAALFQLKKVVFGLFCERKILGQSKKPFVDFFFTV